MGKEWAGLLFPRGKNGPAHSFPGEKTDWGKFRPVTPAIDDVSFSVTGLDDIFLSFMNS